MTPTMFSSASSTQPLRGSHRFRVGEPDWNEFYKNGLPKEVIVIDDDTPPPPSQTSSKNCVPPATRHEVSGLARKRKLGEDPIPYNSVHDPVYRGATLQTNSATSSAPSSDQAGTYMTTSTSLSSAFEERQLDERRKRIRLHSPTAGVEPRRPASPVPETDSLWAYKPPQYPVKRSGDVQVRVAEDPRRDKRVKYDDKEGHYFVIPDTDLSDRYQITRVLGQGTFGKVVQAKDRRKNKFVAVKIIRSVQKYREASKIELRVLQTLKYNDPENRNRCMHLRDCFDFRGHVCIVMDLLGQSVFDFLKGNSYVPFPNSQIQNFARQLFTSVAYLHDLNLIHTDLKPENILLCDDSYQTFTYNRKIPSSSTTVIRQATQRKVLLNTDIRLIDFGSATFHDEYHSTVVSTRHYRAPEIILGLGWAFPCDIWSIGCILVEFFTGDALFQTHDNLDHLAMMEAVCGYRIDKCLIAAVSRIQARCPDKEKSVAKYFKRYKLDYPVPETTLLSKRFVRSMKRLDDIIPATNGFLKNFLDLLKKVFVHDPNKRISARDALLHPWFSEQAPADDGTEAAKIRVERSRLERDLGHIRHNGHL